MPYTLRLSTPYVEGPYGGQLSKYSFSGQNGRKFFQLRNLSLAEDPTSIYQLVTLNLSLTGATGGFRIFPADSTSTNYDTFTVGLAPGRSVMFGVDYDSSWGTASGAYITSSSHDILAPSIGATTVGINPVIGPTHSIEFAIDNTQVLTKREIGSLFCQSNDGEYLINQGGSPITEDETSFGLMRTNPKLSGNVKITVDSANDIWLNSIDAVKELSDDRYKKFRIGKNGSYASDLSKFFDYGGTPPELVFSLYQKDSQYTSTKRSLADQYDRFYQYGVTPLKSKFYDESFSFFAPLYLKKEIPEYFVIFKTPGPINKFSYDLPFDQWPSEVTNQILKESAIIKVFSLKEDSYVGSYIRNIVNHPARTETDLTVSYQQNGYTTFNGISYVKGSFVQAGELLYDYINEENPLTSVEEFITLGFERNKVISSHVINLEFLFDDDTSDNYSINRYFGLYVNAIDLANFTISEGGLQAFSLQLNQLPLPRKGVDGNKLSQKPFVQTNSNGISIFAEAESVDRPHISSPEKEFTSVVNSLTYDANYIYAELPGNFTLRLENANSLTFSTTSGLTATAAYLSSSYDNDVTVVTLDLSSYVSSTPLSLYVTFSLTCDFFDQTNYDLFALRTFDNQLIENTSRFFYVRDHDSKIHSVKSTSVEYYHLDPFTQKKVIQLNLKDQKADISKFGGFTNLLTQADCKPLETRGRAGLSIEISSLFDPNDYLEVSWDPGPTAQGSPLRWRVVANDTGTNPGESWPAYALTSDVNGEYYLAYFNPGDASIYIEDFVRSIQDAFNRFPFKDFEVLAKGNNLHFRSTQEGIASQSTKLSWKISNLGVKVLGVDLTTAFGEANFVGGSNRNYTRGRLAKNIAEGMLPTEYVSTKGGFSEIKINTILGKKIVFSPYMEEPVYDEAGEKLIDFKGVDEYRIVGLADEHQPIQITSDGRMTTYELFKTSFGILSVMPVKDFDTDFIYSEYTKSYLPELKEYFGRYASPGNIIGVTGSTSSLPVTVQFDKDFTFDTYPAYVPFLTLDVTGANAAVLHNDDCQLLFTSAGATADIVYSFPVATSPYVPAIGDIVLPMPDKKGMYFTDLELSKFKGFMALSGVVSSQDEEEFKVLENQWNPDRFTFQLLGSEYDRLAENFLKTLVLKSRVVPYITKWVAPQGKDIRDNPYRFNYHRAFGNMNFSPSSTMDIADPRYHTHEWPYIDAVPDSYPIAEFPEYAFSYMFEQISQKYDFSSLKRDWFTEYFATGYPSELYMDSNGDYVQAKVDPSEKYAYFNYQDYDDNTTALFRGYKFSIKELDTSGAPVNLSIKYNNYKFSAVIETEEDNSFNFEDPIKYNMIVNEKWKFILLKITVKTSSYRYSTGKLKYTDLYTLGNNDEIVEYLYYGSSSYLPSYQTVIPVDRKISTPINFGAYSTNPDVPSVIQYYDDILTVAGDTYREDLREEIVPLQSGSFSNLIGTYSAFPTIFSMSSPSEIFSSRTLKLSNNNLATKVYASTLCSNTLLPISYAWQNVTVYHMCGGNNSFLGLRDRLTFSEILKVLSGSGGSSISFTVHKADGTSVTGNDYASVGFKIDPISPESLTRVFDYFPVSDTDKPQEFYNIAEIGSVLSQQKDLQTLYRYQGNFSPKFRDAIKFWLREDEIFTNLTSLDFLLTNTRVGTELTDFSLLRNQYYNKVSESEVLSISESSGYKPVYPLIDEISIDKRNLFAWSSTWDQNYYRKYTSTKDFSELKGTEEMMEIKSVFGSKAMKVPDQFDLYEYKLFNAPTSTLSPYIENELTYFEDNVNAYLQVNVYNRLLREMMGTSTVLRAKQTFIDVMNSIPGTFDPTTIEDYVDQYLRDNILDLYEIENIYLYVLQTGNPGKNAITTLTSAAQQRPLIEFNIDSGNKFSLPESTLISKGYFAKKDSSVKTLSNLSFEIKYPLDSRFFTSLSIGVKVKRI